MGDNANNGSVVLVLTDLVTQIEGFISSHILIFVLVGLGIVFTVATRGVPVSYTHLTLPTILLV